MHVQIRILVTKEFPIIDHWFDVWHLAKSINQLEKQLFQRQVEMKNCRFR